MYSRNELKERARYALREQGNYWMLVIGGILIRLIDSIHYSGSRVLDDSGFMLQSPSLFRVVLPDIQTRTLTFGIAVSSFLLYAVIALVLRLPFQIGSCRFHLNGSDRPQPDDLLFAYRNDLMGSSLTLIGTRLICFLYLFLLIVPGIIKFYQYSMVPWILAETPYMSGAEARKHSKNMMEGNKLELFCLELSFIGWYILSALTDGLAGLFYVGPYYHLTYAEFYKAVSEAYTRQPYGAGRRM